MTDKVIDVWDIATFDDALLAHLRTKAELVRSYMVTERNNLNTPQKGGNPSNRTPSPLRIKILSSELLFRICKTAPSAHGIMRDLPTQKLNFLRSEGYTFRHWT